MLTVVNVQTTRRSELSWANSRRPEDPGGQFLTTPGGGARVLPVFFGTKNFAVMFMPAKAPLPRPHPWTLGFASARTLFPAERAGRESAHRLHLTTTCAT
jgi:hypothetical protein